MGANILELLKNFVVQINRTVLINRIYQAETDEGLIFQQLYFIEDSKMVDFKIWGFDSGLYNRLPDILYSNYVLQ